MPKQPEELQVEEHMYYALQTPTRPEQVDAVTENDNLSGEEIVLLIEALDALIPFKEDTAYVEKAEVRFVWMPYSRVRHRLKEAVRMSFYDSARGWFTCVALANPV
jgi:hypothetical protein